MEIFHDILGRLPCGIHTQGLASDVVAAASQSIEPIQSDLCVFFFR